MLHEPMNALSSAPALQFCSALSTELFRLIHRINNELSVPVIHCTSSDEFVAKCSRYVTKPTKPSVLISKQLIFCAIRNDELSMESGRIYALYFTLSQNHYGYRVVKATRWPLK
jgi:hypothetical protein